MTPGDLVQLPVRVIRIDGTRIDAQTADGQLIQTSESNFKGEDKDHDAATQARDTTKRSAAGRSR